MIFEHEFDGCEHLAALSQAVERPAHNQTLKPFFVEILVGNAPQEVGERNISSALFALCNNRLGNSAPEVFNRVESEAYRVFRVSKSEFNTIEVGLR